MGTVVKMGHGVCTSLCVIALFASAKDVDNLNIHQHFEGTVGVCYLHIVNYHMLPSKGSKEYETLHIQAQKDLQGDFTVSISARF